MSNPAQIPPSHFPYELGEPLEEGQVTLFLLHPLPDSPPPSPFALIPLPLAQDQGLVEVGEAQDGPTVGTIEIVNKGNDFILVLAGTALKGGLQDRQIGHDVVLMPQTVTSIGAFCVEQGRWNPSREGVATDRAFEAQAMLTTRAVRHAASVQRDQSSVWEEVTRVNALHQVKSPTESHFATLEAMHGEQPMRRHHAANRILNHLTDTRRPVVGVAWGSPGEGLEIRSFANASTTRAFAQTLANTIAIEATAPATDERFEAITAEQVLATVAALEPVPSQWEHGDRQGTELKHSQPLAFSACWYSPTDGDALIATASWQRLAS